MRRYSVVVLAAAAVAFASQAEAVHFNVISGVWEVTNSPKVGGQLPISDAELARIPAAQRARFEAAMKQSMGAMQKPRTFRECLTQDKINKGFDLDKAPNQKCVKTATVNSSTSLQMKVVCKGQQETVNGTFQFVTVNPKSVAGTADMVISRGGKTMTVDSTITGHWVGSDCGKLKDNVEEVN
jgi:hypothetical protein